MWNEQDRIRLVPKVRRLHQLGEKSLYEFLVELIAGDEILSADIEHQLYRYCQLEPHIVEALGCRDLIPPLTVADGEQQ